MPEFIATPAQSEFMLSEKYMRVIGGPVGSGKSVASTNELVRLATLQEPNELGVRKTRMLIIRNTADQLRSTTMKTVFDWYPPGVYGRWKATEKTFFVEFPLPDGTVVYSEWFFVPLDTPDDVRKLLSLEATFAWLNECREIRPEIVDALATRVGRYPSAKDGGCTRKGIIADTNMPNSDDWWGRHMKNPPDNWSVHIQPPAVIPMEYYIEKFKEDPPTDLAFRDADGDWWVVNPEGDNLNNLPRDYYVNAGSGKDKEFINVYLACEYGMALDGRAVYEKTFRRIKHFSPEPLEPIKSKAYPVVVGVDFGRCYDDETEVLTETGWKFFKDVDPSERVATLNPDTREFEYTDINFKVEFDYEGDMLLWEGTNINLCVTPEHRFPYTNRDTPDVVRWASAEEMSQQLTAHKYAIVAPREWQGALPADLPLQLDPITYAEFMGWWLAEGHVDKGTNRVTITQTKPAPALEALAEKLEGYGVDIRPKGTGFRFSNAELADYLRQFGSKHAGERRVPDELMLGTREMIETFVAAYTAGDGHLRPPRCASGYEEHTIWFNNREIAGQFQDLGQKLGWGSALRRQKGGEATFADGRKVMCQGGYVVQFKKNWERVELRPSQFSRVPYNGKIYCLNVPHHTLCVRRKGKVSWNGNTPAAAFTQITPSGTLNVMSEITSENMGIKTFIEELLLPHIAKYYQGCELVYAPDPAGWQRSQVNEESPVDVMRKFGFKIKKPNTNNPLMRIEAVEAFLTTDIDGKAGFQLYDRRCPVLAEGFRGRYRWKENRSGDLASAGRQPQIVKDFVSHVHDALQYACVIQKQNLGLSLDERLEADTLPIVTFEPLDDLVGY